MRKIPNEKILILGKFAYLKFYDDQGDIDKEQYKTIADDSGDKEFKRLFWQLYWKVS